MKKDCASQSGFFIPRVLLAFALCSAGALLAMFSLAPQSGAPIRTAVRDAKQLQRDMPVPGGKADDLDRMELEWHNRLTYPTGLFNPVWVRVAAAQDALIRRAIPLGRPAKNLNRANAPLALNPNGFTSLGPQPEHMTGCTGCYDYVTTEGRVNSIAVDPTTTTNGSIVAYLGTVGGGVWKTTNCCSSSTSWTTTTTDDPLLATISIDSVT